MTRLAERRRARLERLAPRFWRPARSASAKTRRYFRFLLLTRRASLFVAERQGEIVGMLQSKRVAAPPVDDPGGTTRLVDDFCVAEPSLWPSVGAALLDAALAEAKAASAAQLIVVAPVGDEAQSHWLAERGVAPVSTWWVHSL